MAHRELTEEEHLELHGMPIEWCAACKSGPLGPDLLAGARKNRDPLVAINSAPAKPKKR